MGATITFQERLNALAADYESWRAEADSLLSRTDMDNDALLLAVEENAGRLYRGIATFDALKAEIDLVSHVASGQLADVGEAIRLLLLEVTEFGTQLYSRRSLASMEVLPRDQDPKLG